MPGTCELSEILRGGGQSKAGMLKAALRKARKIEKFDIWRKNPLLFFTFFFFPFFPFFLGPFPPRFAGRAPVSAPKGDTAHFKRVDVDFFRECA